MIKYDPLWRTLKEKGISQYQLIKDYGIDKAQLQRLRQNLVVKTLILNRLCQILNCRIEEIMEYVPDDKRGRHREPLHHQHRFQGGFIADEQRPEHVFQRLPL